MLKRVSHSSHLMAHVLNSETARNVKGGAPHSVGSIEIQIFRQDPNAHKNHAKDSVSDDTSSSEGTPDLGNAKRAPTYEDYTEWWQLNPCVDEDAKVPTPFEVGGVNHKKLTGARDRIAKKWPGDYKLWASFKFLLLSTADFHKLGYIKNPKYKGAPWSEAKATSKKSNAKDAPSASKATSVIDADANAVADDYDDDDTGKPTPGPVDVIDKSVKTSKDKEVRKKNVKSSASEGTEVYSVLASLMESAARQETTTIEDSFASEISGESPDTEIIARVEKPAQLSYDLSNDEEASEPAVTVLPVKSIKTESVDLANDEADRNNKVHINGKKPKPMSMPGIEGAPANVAWKDPTRFEWNHSNILTSNSDKLPPTNTDPLHIEPDLTSVDSTRLLSLDNNEHLRHSSVPCKVGEADEKIRENRFKSLGIEASSSPWEPITPPASSKKQDTKHFDNFGDEQRGLLGEFKGASQIESAARAIVIEDNYSDSSSREASPTINIPKRIAEKKAEKMKQRCLEFSFEPPAPDFEEPVPSSNVDLMKVDFDQFIHGSLQPEDTEMVDAVEAEVDPKTSSVRSRSPSPDANTRSSITDQGQNSVNMELPSQSQDLVTSQKEDEDDSQTPTQEISQTAIEESARVQRVQMLQSAKRYPSSAVPQAKPEKLTEFRQPKVSPDTEMTGTDSNDMPPKAKKSNDKLNNAPVDIGNQQDGRQDSPAKFDDSTIVVAQDKPAKQPKARAPDAAKPSSAPKMPSAPKTQPTPVSKTPASQKTTTAHKTPAANAESSSTTTNPEQSQTKSKKPAAKNPKAASASKSAKAATPTSVEGPKPKSKGRATAGANDNKRKADQMSSASSSSGPNKTNVSPAVKQTSIVEREAAAADARMQAALEKKRDLEERLKEIRAEKLKMEEVGCRLFDNFLNN